MLALPVNGIQLHYLEQGRGAAVVFLHGLGSSSDDWGLQLPAFAARYRALAFDLRAHGRSRFDGAFTVEQMAADGAAALQRLDTGPAHVVGLSLGGCAALALAIEHAGCVRSLTLVNTFARFQLAGWRGVARAVQRLWLLQTASMRDVAGYVARGLFPRPDQAALRAAAINSLSKNSKATYLAAARALRRFDVTGRLGAVGCPALVVIGERDRTVPRAAGEALARGIPRARRWLVPDSGHATPYDQAEAFNRTLMEFMETVGVTARR